MKEREGRCWFSLVRHDGQTLQCVYSEARAEEEENNERHITC
jgi:hypothetical protein